MILEVGLYHLGKYFNICYKIITKEPLPPFKWYYIIHTQIGVFSSPYPDTVGESVLATVEAAE